jgi:hypothetical protein
MRSWLSRNWQSILVSIVLLYVEMVFALRWDLKGKRIIYWWFIIDQSKPLLQFYVVGIAGILAIIVSFLVNGLKWYIRVAVVVLFCLPLPMAYLRGTFLHLSKYEHVSSMTFQGHVYHLSYMELSGIYYSLHQCDRIGLFCHEIDNFGHSSVHPNDVTLIADSDKHLLLVLDDISIVREYSTTDKGMLVGRWPGE